MRAVSGQALFALLVCFSAWYGFNLSRIPWLFPRALPERPPPSSLPLLPNSSDFLVSSQGRLSVVPGKRRGLIRGMADREADPGDFLLIGPGEVGNVTVLDANCMERLGSRAAERRGRGFVKEDVQEWFFFRGE
jgi:hypothetical protein